MLDREAEELDSEIIDSDDKTNHAERQRAVLAKQRRWALKKRRMLLDGVVSELGTPCSTPAEEAETIREHWQQVFKGIPADKSRWDYFK
eukprot:11158914-Heterocapsa_arctica.AAC.1